MADGDSIADKAGPTIEKCTTRLAKLDDAARANELGCFSTEDVPDGAAEEILSLVQAVLDLARTDADAGSTTVLRKWAEAGGVRAAANLFNYVDASVAQSETLVTPALRLLEMYPDAYRVHADAVGVVLAASLTDAAGEPQTPLARVVQVLEGTLQDTPPAAAAEEPAAAGAAEAEAETEEAAAASAATKAKAEPERQRSLAIQCIKTLGAVVATPAVLDLFGELGGPDAVLDAIQVHKLTPIALPF